MSVDILVRLDEGAKTPVKCTDGAAGYDLGALEDTDVHGSHQLSTKVRTGVYLEIPKGYVGLLIERSSLHARGASLANNIGVIDSDYRGEILVALFANNKMIKIKKDERIAQLVIVAIPDIQLLTVSKLNGTKRGKGGFGSTSI